MAKKAVLQIAKQDEDLREVDSSGMVLDSLRFLPKIYLVKKLMPNIPEGYVWGEYEYTHNLGYPPMYLYYDEHSRFQENEYSDQVFSPHRFIWGSYGKFAYMSNTKFNDDAGGSTNRYLILMNNPLLAPASPSSPTSHPDPRIKVGEDLENDPDYEASIDTKYQTLKVHMQDQLVCNLPQWSATSLLGGNSLRYDWFDVTHNLGFPPVYTPFGINTTGLDVVSASGGNVASDFLVNDLNDVWAKRWSYDFGRSADNHLEGLWIYVDNTKYYVGYRRQNWDYENGYTFPARTVRVNYTIFNLPINEEFNLLS